MNEANQAATGNYTTGRGQQPREKRVALDAAELKQEIFGLFRRVSQYTIEDIQNILNQPREPVKRILDEICDFNRNSRYYELKRSYIH